MIDKSLKDALINEEIAKAKKKKNVFLVLEEEPFDKVQELVLKNKMSMSAFVTNIFKLLLDDKIRIDSDEIKNFTK